MKLSSPAETIAIAEHPLGVSASERSPFVKFLKSLLSSAQGYLPGSIYDPFYESSFRVYKSLLRLSYTRHLVYESIFGSHSALTRFKLVHRVMPYSLVGTSGLEATYDAAMNVIADSIPGDFVECGVARGGCSALMAAVARTDMKFKRKMWLFDSFQGLPDPTGDDFVESGSATGDHVRPLPKGACLGTKNEVEDLLFTKFGLSRESVLLIEGWFQETLPVHASQIRKIAVLRIDGDWYDSTLCCLQYCYDLVSPGGYIIIDDYGTCFGCKKAVHQFLESNGISVMLIPDGRGGVLFSKPA